MFTAFFLLACTLGEGEINSKLVFVKVSRKIDLASQLAKFETSISLENGGDSSVSFFYFAIEPSLLDKLAYVGITVSAFRYICDLQFGRKLCGMMVTFS